MNNINGLGLGLRRDFLQEIDADGFLPDWWEIAPENWFDIPFHHREKFEEVISLRPVVAHGLSLSIGSHEPIDKKFLKQMKSFLDRYKIEDYSDHISFTSLLGSQTYDLLPLSMTKKSIEHTSDKIKRVMDYMQRELILENATYYYVPDSDMREVEFINELMEKSGAKLLLDVNNIYVNAQNHGFDAHEFLNELDVSKAAYIHVAGHYEDEELGMIIDSHGMPVKQEVWDFLGDTLKKVDIPVMIERDNNIPQYSVMEKEYKILKKVVKNARI
ncbi:DUF692 domain-containing protein [Sulfurospirillum arcachonense]|uniref:DUF692 domain-containing protein n=1 Tax=Sulfurospirillum arcachonense TaxID=57666 RepID=UPI0004AF08AE|nr:DUF692 domain-containing protein [Sulfurospirillum arcachonense]